MMFGLPKLLVLLLILLAVWYGFKWVGRAQAIREQQRRSAASEQGRRQRPREPVAHTEDMVKCAACGVYVPATGARSCERAGCPYP
jgi:uncharacterized protein